MAHDSDRITRIAKSIMVAFRRYNLNESKNYFKIAQNPNTQPDELKAIADEILLRGYLDEESRIILREVASNRRTPSSTLERLVNLDDQSVSMAAKENKAGRP